MEKASNANDRIQAAARVASTWENKDLMRDTQSRLTGNDCWARSDTTVIAYLFKRRSTRHAQTDKVAEARVIRMNTGSVARCRFSIATRIRCATVSAAKIPPDVIT